jgi:hypothetical protein
MNKPRETVYKPLGKIPTRWLVETVKNSKLFTNPSTWRTHMDFVTYDQYNTTVHPMTICAYLSQVFPGDHFLLVKRSHQLRPAPSRQQPNSSQHSKHAPRGPHASPIPVHPAWPARQWSPRPRPVTRRVTLPRRFRTDRYRGRFKTSQPRGATWTAARETAGERTARPGPGYLCLAWLCVR